jgi:hypothetical protein
MSHFIPFKDGKQIDPPSIGSWETRADGLYPRDAGTAKNAGLTFPAPAPAAQTTTAEAPAKTK